MKTCTIKNLILIAFALLSVSCATTHKVVLGDAIRFSDDAVTSYSHKDGVFKNQSKQSDPYTLYSEENGVPYSELAQMKNFIHRNDYGKLTAGYYALDIGLDRVRYVRRNYFRHDLNTKYYIIYMTDGLDNTSVQVARNHKQLWFTLREKTYAKHIQRKIKNTMGAFKIRQNTFKIFPIMFIGDDMKQIMQNRGHTTIDEIKNEADKKMQYYRGSSRGTSTPEVLLGTDFKVITKDFEEMLLSSGFEFYVPKGYRGQQIRMSLKNDNGEEIEIEGKLRKKWFTWCLTNIKYPDNVYIPDQRFLYKGKPIKYLYASNRHDRKALSAFFRMEDIKLNGKNYKVTSVRQEHGEYYETNSEYDAFKSSNSDAYFLLIMDVSSSLGDQKENEKEAMEDILNILIKTTTN